MTGEKLSQFDLRYLRTRSSIVTGTTYTLVAGQTSVFDTTSNAITATLPLANSVTAGTVLGAKVILPVVTGLRTIAVTITCAGSDKINRTTGASPATSLTLVYQGQSVLLESDGTSIWTIVSTDLPLTQLDTRYAAASAVPASLNVLLGSIDVPRRSLDLFRGAPNYVETTLNGAINSTVTTITVANQNLTLVGENPLIQIDSERMLVIRGQGTVTLIVKRGADGTTAASHADKANIVRDKVRNVVCFGDSTAQGDATGVTGVWDAYVERTRRILSERFGGSLGHGFQGMWRQPHASNDDLPFDFAGSWNTASHDAVYYCGPWLNDFGSAASATLAYTRPPRVRIGQVDVWYVVWSNSGTDSGTDWSYSLDGGSTWLSNPNANVDTVPTSTTTLASADNARRCDYWTGTQTMTLASTSGIASNAGFWVLDVGSGGAGFKCRALFTYDGVSGSTLTNVKYVGPAAYNALTTSTGDTAQQRAEIRRSSIVTNDPTSFIVRCANSSGTGRLCNVAGLDLWSSVPTFGITKGVKVHNLGYSGNTLAAFIGARMVNDIGTTNGSPTMTSAGRGAFAAADVGSQVINANVPAGTIITAVGSATSCTLSANATATVTAGAVSNPTTIQGNRGNIDMVFNGAPASLIPSLVIEGCWTNDLSAPVSTQGGDQTMTATFTSGSGTVTINAGNGIETLDVGALFMNPTLGGTVTASGTVISARTDATHITISPVAGANASAIPVNVGAPSATVAQAIQDRLTVFHSGGIGCYGFTAYANALLVVPFEQGVTRLTGISSTAAYQAAYRAAMHAWATANKVTTLDIYIAWSLEGNTGYAAANADNLMDSADTSGFHEGPVGYRDMASRITRLLEFA